MKNLHAQVSYLKQIEEQDCPEHLEICKQSPMGRELPSVSPLTSRGGPGLLCTALVVTIKCRVIDEALFDEKLFASPP